MISEGETTYSYNYGPTRIQCKANRRTCTECTSDYFLGEVRVYTGEKYHYSLHSKTKRSNQREALEDARKLAKEVKLNGYCWCRY